MIWSNKESVFARYVEDNNTTLTGIGVIATVTALFLGVNPENYGSSLREIQLLLLIFLTLGSLYLSLTTVKWLDNNFNTWASGLVGVLILLFPYYTIKFIVENFRQELGDQMYMVWFSVFMVFMFFLQKTGYKLEDVVVNKLKLHSVFVYPVISMLSIYCILVFIDVYLKYAKQETLILKKILIEPFTEWTIYIVFAMAVAGETIRVYVRPKVEEKTYTRIYFGVPILALIIFIFVWAIL